jgi:serine/threonine-protein kinase
MPIALCPDCGGKVSNGLCPRCLVKLGLDRPDPPQGEVGATLDLPARAGSVLETLAATIGAVPRVLLRDTAFGEEPSPIIRPSNGQDSSTRYRIDGEIARGGMGAILKGRDPDLGRDVAIKVLREDLRGNDDLVRRFVEEAQIGGQLQHPGVVPIYELGTFADKRPFFCMKLVKGQTLADRLASRPTPSADLPRFLAIFAAMAQTMAYAHTRGVIHRDLKPSNVMVGSFGEVQVMDWGLAKVLARGGVVNDAKAGKETSPETLIATARSGSDADLSHAGSVMGTPSFMPPEQARGEIDRVDERADVFALGSILAEILTGAPAFTGRTSGEILRKAARGDTADALARLAACGAEADLIALAGDCLAVEPEDRPRDANAVSERITGYLAGVQERVQTAERDRAVAVALAVEERKRRKVQLALAASVLAITAMGGLGVLYEQRQRASRAATVAKVVGEASTLRDLARAEPEEVARWQTALAALKQAEGVAGGDPEALGQIAALRVEVQAGAEAADRDRVLLDKLVDIRSAKADNINDDLHGDQTDADYTEAFRDAGFDLTALPPAEAGARIKARPPGIALAMAAALDDWATLRRGRRKDPTGASRLVEVARAADPDPWRNDLRTTLVMADEVRRQQVLQTLARTAKLDELGAVSLDLLGTALADVGDRVTAEKVLRRAQIRHAGDVWINSNLADVLLLLNHRDDAIRFYTVARALRPETAYALADVLANKGESDEAIEVLRELTRLRPKLGHYHFRLGVELAGRGRPVEADAAFEQAVAAFQESIRLKPDHALAYNNLGAALFARGKRVEASAAFGESIRLKPDHALAYSNFGVLLKGSGALDEAVVAHREAIRLAPDEAVNYSNLGLALDAQGKHAEAVTAFRESIRLKPDFADVHHNLGNALDAQGNHAEAVTAFGESIRLKPDDVEVHYDFGVILQGQGKLDEAIAEYREAIRLQPNLAKAHNNLGAALKAQGKTDEAVAAIHESIRLKPDLAEAHHNLGVILTVQGKTDEAIAEYRESIRLKPDLAEAHHNLGNALDSQGKTGEAVVAFRESIRLKPDDAQAYYSLGNALSGLGKTDEAVAEYRESIRLKLDFAAAHYNLGNALNGQGKTDEAVAAFRESIRLKPDLAEAHCNLGHALRNQGNYAEALAELGRGHELGSKLSDWGYPSARWVAEAERLASLAERLPALLTGEDRPKDVLERLTLARMCHDTKRQATAARFWAEALEADPKLGDDRQAQHRYNAACTAALAGSGQTKDDPPPNDDAKAKLRGQALGWLRAELAAWAKVLETGPAPLQAGVVPTLQHWKGDADLAGVRDAAALAKFPEGERKEWQALWAEVDALLKRVGQP